MIIIAGGGVEENIVDRIRCGWRQFGNFCLHLPVKVFSLNTGKFSRDVSAVLCSMAGRPGMCQQCCALWLGDLGCVSSVVLYGRDVSGVLCSMAGRPGMCQQYCALWPGDLGCVSSVVLYGRETWDVSAVLCSMAGMCQECCSLWQGDLGSERRGRGKAGKK